MYLSKPNSLRGLFTTILPYHSPSSPCNLWMKFKDSLSDDFKRNRLLDEQQVFAKMLESIESFLRSIDGLMMNMV